MFRYVLLLYTTHLNCNKYAHIHVIHTHAPTHVHAHTPKQEFIFCSAPFLITIHHTGYLTWKLMVADPNIMDTVIIFEPGCTPLNQH